MGLITVRYGMVQLNGLRVPVGIRHGAYGDALRGLPVIGGEDYASLGLR